MTRNLFTLMTLAFAAIAFAGCGPAGGVTTGGPMTEEDKAAAQEFSQSVEDAERAHFQKR